MLTKTQKLYSFDIFDTLITRNMSTPGTIFYIMECLLKKNGENCKFPQILIENFTNIRRDAEVFARENARVQYNKKEISFNDIYSIIQHNYSLSETQINYLKDLEIITEQNNLHGIKENINKIKNLLKAQQEVILISNMYFSEKIIRKFLLNIDSVFSDIKIYVSNDYNLTKSTGLYNLIKKSYPNLKEWTHFGDNLKADIISAKLHGIKTIHYKFENLQPHEKYILKKNQKNYDYKIICGTSRLLRNENNNLKYQFGCSFAAPLLYAYVKWVLQQCIYTGIKNIYFVSRDGFILKQIADILIKENNLDLKSNYFNSSRRACRIITENNYESFIEIVFNEKSISSELDNICTLLNISLNNIKKFLNKKHLNNKKALKKELLENIALRRIIIENNKTKIDLFKDYLKQEIPAEVKKIAFVDVNGSGRTQDMTTEILNQIINCKTYNFFINLSPVMKQHVYSIKCAYNLSVNYNGDWIELLTRSTEGQTIGYKYIENIVVPIKECECNENIIRWGFNDYIDGILDYTKLLTQIEKINNININVYNLYQYMQEYIIKYLDKEYADVIGTIPFSDYGYESNIKEFAPKINLFNLFHYKYSDFISISRCNWISKPFFKLVKAIISPKTYGYISRDKKLAYLKIFKYKINISSLLWKDFT